MPLPLLDTEQGAGVYYYTVIYCLLYCNSKNTFFLSKIKNFASLQNSEHISDKGSGKKVCCFRASFLHEFIAATGGEFLYNSLAIEGALSDSLSVVHDGNQRKISPKSSPKTLQFSAKICSKFIQKASQKTLQFSACGGAR